jgi:hypothetical protein
MDLVIYTKKGKRNYKEIRLIEKIKPLLQKQLDENPALYGKFVPAKNYQDLEKIYNELSTPSVEFEEIEKNENNINEKSMAKKKDLELEDENLTDSLGLGADDDDEDTSDFVDPFNREEPIVRDYVMDGSLEPEGTIESNGQTDFNEPMTFDEAFELPDSEEPIQPKSRRNEEREPREKPVKEPINPDFDDMSSSKKRKSTKKFAKYIVETVCMLSEKGFVWYANKDINEAKLTEYELKGDMDLSLLVTLEDGQEVTVKQFFQVQCLKAEQLAIIDKEEKDDLAEALAEVLMEKGVGPTPTQELMLIALKIFGGQAITLMSIKSQTNALLGQLRAMKSGEVEASQERYEEEYIAPEAPKANSYPQAEQQTFDDLEPESNYQQEDEEDEISILEKQDPLLLEKETKTLE